MRKSDADYLEKKEISYKKRGLKIDNYKIILERRERGMQFLKIYFSFLIGVVFGMILGFIIAGFP